MPSRYAYYCLLLCRELRDLCDYRRLFAIGRRFYAAICRRWLLLWRVAAFRALTPLDAPLMPC